jgi:hypothetical protein
MAFSILYVINGGSEFSEAFQGTALGCVSGIPYLLQLGRFGLLFFISFSFFPSLLDFDMTSSMLSTYFVGILLIRGKKGFTLSCPWLFSWVGCGYSCIFWYLSCLFLADSKFRR